MADRSLPPAAPDWALFLDFDGTLTEIAGRPDAVRVEPAIVASLAALSRRFDDALAIVSGRTIADLDLQLGRRFAAAGVHGLEMRRAPQAPVEHLVAQRDLAEVRDAVAQFAETHDGVWIEEKRSAIAVHYRERPELGEATRDAVDRAIAGHEGLHVLAGKMIFEVKPDAADKGKALAALMEMLPFHRRRPVFAGDDVTDEDGFVTAEALGGFGIKIGSGDTRARYRVPSVAAFGEWLSRLAGDANPEAEAAS